MSTKREREQARLEERVTAATYEDTIKKDYRFLVVWLAVATTASFYGNIGNETLHLLDGVNPHTVRTVTFVCAVIWAAFAPALLMMAVHAVSTARRLLKHLRDEDVDDLPADRHRVLQLLVVGVVIGALVWSGIAIHEFGVRLGLNVWMAWVPPAVIDLSVACATLALVKAAPIRARLKAAADVGVPETGGHTGMKANEHQPEQPFTPESEKAVTSRSGTRKPQLNARAQRMTEPAIVPVHHRVNGNVPELLNGNPTEVDRAHERALTEFTPEHNGHDTSVEHGHGRSVTDPFTTEAHDILKRTGKRTPAATVAAVLRRLDEPGAKVSVIAAELGMGERTVREIRDARRPHLVQAAV